MGRRILLGVTGSIAAYKAAELVRLFVKNGDEVRVVMTPAATRFVAPASANTLAKLRHGIADNLLTSTLLATRAPVAVAPAMNDGMWENAATQENVAALAARGVRVIAPAEGELACGSSGKGRMASPEAIFEALS